MRNNDLISRSALKSFLCKCCNILHLEDPCEPGECNVMEVLDEQPTVDAVPVERLGKIGKLFLPYEGCPRGHVGRMGAPATLEEEALYWGVITDVDGGRWVPVVEDVMHELIEKANAADTNVGGKWIRVEDEKPKRRGEYFVSYVFADYDMRFYGSAFWNDDIETNGYVTGPHFSNEGMNGMKVTHWMDILPVQEVQDETADV